MAERGDSLSERELDVLEWVVQGATNREIALALSISPNTVKVHLRNIYTKLGVSSRTEAMREAMAQGVVPLPQATADGPREVAEGGAGVGAAAASPAEQRFDRRWLVVVAMLVGGVTLLSFLSLPLLRAGISPAQESAATSVPFATVPVGSSRWFEGRPMPAARRGMAASAVGLNLYLIGGLSAEGVSNRVDILATNAQSWSTGAGKPTAVTDVTAAVLGGEIYVPGGRLADGQPSNVVEVYSPANDAWRSVAPLPQATAGALALADGTFLYLFGGWDGSTYSDQAFRYDPGSNGWRPLPPMNGAKAFATGDLVRGALYVVGGYDGVKESAGCQVLDPVTITWSDCPLLLQARGAAAAAVVVNKLYIFGGGLAGSVPYGEFYDPTLESWQVVDVPMLADEPAWTYLGAAHVESQIFVAGGQRGGQLSAGIFIFSPLSNRVYLPAAPSD